MTASERRLLVAIGRVVADGTGRVELLSAIEAIEREPAHVCREGWHDGVKVGEKRWRCVLCGFEWDFPAPQTQATTHEETTK